ncbi:LysR substrate-binding domain-containing protein [Piscinibacter sakaiensis]|uniref:Transcriptional regulator, LysR family n=1 Tax=Piscinibacter sakaiensis TaxID=1547922 RepID=A0A0K8P6A6_PISS1|nr:LysR substrate-binding domain-containing protein [Piscinibacter sakaiensis]GAP38208.1 transcriptional regulator, LysR family [Piscinibacter sakaiensis]
MKLQHLRNLVAVADTGSIRAAAAELGVSQPAITQSLHQLEQELQASLLSRNATGTNLTAIGKVLVPRARAITNEVHRAREEIRQLVASPQGSISIGASAFALTQLIPRAVASLRSLQPRVQVLIRDDLFPAAAPALREGTLDLVISPLPPKLEQREFNFQELLVLPVYVVARRDHPLAGRPRTLAELAEADWMVSGGPGGYNGALEKVFADRGLKPPQASVRADSITAVCSLLACSDLLALLPRALYAHGDTALEALEVVDVMRPSRYGVITRADVPLSATAERFLAFVRDEATLWMKNWADRRGVD